MPWLKSLQFRAGVLSVLILLASFFVRGGPTGAPAWLRAVADAARRGTLQPINWQQGQNLLMALAVAALLLGMKGYAVVTTGSTAMLSRAGVVNTTRWWRSAVSRTVSGPSVNSNAPSQPLKQWSTCRLVQSVSSPAWGWLWVGRLSADISQRLCAAKRMWVWGRLAK